jgi:riboflavin transporter 2
MPFTWQILLAVTLAFCLSYAKVAIATTVMGSGGRSGLLWVGVATQVGSLVGAVITFICVTVVGVFVAMPSEC